jgi:hypothetical protein
LERGAGGFEVAFSKLKEKAILVRCRGIVFFCHQRNWLAKNISDSQVVLTHPNFDDTIKLFASKGNTIETLSLA